MALTYGVVAPAEGVHADIVPGAYKEILVTVTDTSYSTGGDLFGLPQLQALVPATLIFAVEVVNNWLVGAASAAVAAYNTSTGKIQAFGGTPAAGVIPESAAASNVGTCTLKVRYR